MFAKADDRPRITAGDKVVPSPSVVVGEVNGEIVALDVQNGMCFGLNAVGSEIWRRLQSETTVGELCRSLSETYDVDYARCEGEVIELLEELRSESMIDIRRS